MDLRCKLQTLFLINLKKLRNPKKQIDEFIEILIKIETIINENQLDNTLTCSTSLIKCEFLKNFYADILYEILFNFNHPDLFAESDKLKTFKDLLTNIITQKNYQNTFEVLFKLSCSLK